MSLDLIDYEEMQKKNNPVNDVENDLIESIDNPGGYSDFERMTMLEKALIHVQTDWQEVINYLDNSYSRFYFHEDIKEMTPRETILYLFDGVFVGFAGGKYPYSTIKEGNSYLNDLWDLYKKMMKESKFVVSKQQASYDYFKKFFEAAFTVRDYRPTDLRTGGRLSTRKLVHGLPPIKKDYRFLSVEVVRERRSQNK